MKTPYQSLVLLLLGLLVWQGASAQSNQWGLPPSPNGKLAAALLDAINDADPAVHEHFIEAHYAPAFKDQAPMETHLKHFQQMHTELAGAEVNGVDMRMGAKPMLNLMMKTEAEAYVGLMLTLEPGAAPRIADLQIEKADGPPPTDRMIETFLATIKEADAEVHRQFVEEHFAPAFKNELPMETHLALLQQMHQELAGAAVAEVNVMSRGGGDETVSMRFQTKAGELHTVTFDIQLSSPPRLITLSLTEE